MTTHTASSAPWTGTVPVDDTALFVSDTGGSGRPIVYLNGAYADQKHWQRVIGELGSGYRHITFDERARGRSQQSADYTFQACLRDVDAVLRARGVQRPILVGWSYGAFVAAHWAEQRPDRIDGAVAVDGALPYGLTGEQGAERIRRLFKRLRWLFPIASRIGLAARMSAAQHAEVNIELNEIAAACAPVLERITCPMSYVLATGSNLGGGAAEMEQARASLDPVLAVNPHLRISAKVDSNHSKILKKDFAAIARAVRETAAARDREGSPN